VWSLSGIILIAVLSIGATVLTGKTPLLGLDLKGGVSVVEKPEGRVNATILQEAVNIIDNRVNGLGVSNSNVTRQGNDIVIELPGAKNDTQVLNVVGETAQLFFRPVECLIAPYAGATGATGTTRTTGATTTTVPAKSKATGKAKTTGKAKHAAAPLTLGPSDARLISASHPAKTSGTKTSGTKTSGTKTSGTKTSGTKTSGTAGTSRTATTGTKGAGSTPPSTAAASVPSTTSTTSLASSICNLSSTQQSQYMPPHGTSHGVTPAAYDTMNATVVLPYYADFVKGHYNPSVRYVLGPAEMTGSIVSTATAEVNTQTDQWEVVLNFTGKGSTLFNKYAAAHYACYQQNPSNPPYCAQQAIELDATVESAPAIEAASFPGSATISGSTSAPFTSTQAQDLANALNYGSLPVRFVAQDISNVSPQIGTDSLKAGAIAGAVAVLLVLLYLLVYYRALGLVVVIGICMSGALLYAITTLLSQTNGLALTLSGVIGLIVSVGVTADSCVVYFERLKEEIRTGRTVRASVEKGFSRAFRTILAADFSSFIAALVLYMLTVGDVRGFAFFLGLATLLNVVTTYFFTRPLVILMGRRSALTGGGVLGVGRGLGAGGYQR
jgi:preprotein translocase subunit SecD